MSPEAQYHDSGPGEPASTAFLRSLDAGELKAVQASVLVVIENLTERTQFVESRREILGAQVGGGILGTGAVLLTVAFASVSYRPARVALVALGVMALLLGLLVQVVYLRQTHIQYEFSDTERGRWKWFYRYALVDHAKFKRPWWRLILIGTKTNSEETAQFQQQWNMFQNLIPRTIVSSVDDVQQDLRQLFVLHVIDRYRNQYVDDLRELIVYGLMISIAVSAAAFVTAWAGS